jgi:glutamate/tyrosine decarboxylase-like PLP-dependent enzyme
MSPAAAVLEETALRWLVELLGLPAGTAAGFVSGATMGNFTGLAAARYQLLKRRAWDVTTQGLYGAPEVRVVVGDEVHVSLLKGLSLLGFGSGRVVRVPVDDRGRMRPEALPALDDMTILCLQAGNVNSGAFDPMDAIIPIAQAAGAWVHVDAAFGLWALASPAYAHLAKGLELADSIGTDAHKWLNVPYDSGIAFCRHPEALGGAMAASPAAYLDMMASRRREPDYFTPEMSRRGRGIEIWAALRSLGRSGLAELVERTCRLAQRFAEGLQAAGFTVHNDVVLNQVVVSFGDAERTLAVIRQVQEDGVLWAGSTVWKGVTAMRISVSGWATTDSDVDLSLEAIIKANRRISGSANPA